MKNSIVGMLGEMNKNQNKLRKDMTKNPIFMKKANSELDDIFKQLDKDNEEMVAKDVKNKYNTDQYQTLNNKYTKNHINLEMGNDFVSSLIKSAPKIETPKKVADDFDIDMDVINFDDNENNTEKDNKTSLNLIKQRQVKKLVEDSSSSVKNRRELKNPNTSSTSDSINKSRTIIKTDMKNHDNNDDNNNMLVEENTPDKTNKKLTFDNQNEINSNEKNSKVNHQYSAIPRSVDSKVPMVANNEVLIYWYDCVEESMKGDPNVIFFGKVWEPISKSYQSISMVIRKMPRTLYVFPKLEKLQDENFTTDQIYTEFETLRKQKFSYIKDYKCKFVKRKYCFELPIPKGEYDVMKVLYPAEYGIVPQNIVGETFDYIFGKQNSLLEKVLLSRKIKGPCWLRVKNVEIPKNFNITWSKFEINVNNYKDIFVVEDSKPMPMPPLKVLSISLKSLYINGINELLAISLIMKENYYVEDLEKSNKEIISSTILRKIENKKHPSDIYEKLSLKSKKEGNNLTIAQNETALISIFLSKISTYDPDVIVGHNLYSGQLDLILNRISKLKITNWTKLGKFKRDNVLPKSLMNSHFSGGNLFARTCTYGRLICDTFLSCRDILRESNYNLSFLSQKYLNQNLPEMDLPQIISNCDTQTGLSEIIELNEFEGFVTFDLMDKLSILQLTKQLTNIAGNIWVKSLQNSRADRCEMLVLHEYRKNKYLLPDKIQNKGEKLDDLLDEGEEQNPKQKGPQYSGGLVLEPKAGLYDNIVLLLDFNSLYPSIIQEYNICFTTVQRKPTQFFIQDKEKRKRDDDENLEELENTKISKEPAILPGILESLIKKRKIVKNIMKKETDPFKLQNLEIQQKAIKLSANSLYGYLGYKNSRFYAKTIAALITMKGRTILKNTVDSVQNDYKMDVIYGDTDSIMINTLTNDIKEAVEMGLIVKKKVNEKYKLLEIDIDGIFKTILLLKKKKYAALKVKNLNDLSKVEFVPEYKGLDLVRRDWCGLSKTVGLSLLGIILKGAKSKEEIVVEIFEYLKSVQSDIDNDKIPIDDFIITKQLTKKIEEYNDIKSLAHVKIAKRMREAGDCSIKENTYIPFVVCRSKEGDTTITSKSLADKAFHPKELESMKDKIELDLNWYKENQILSSISRLCKHIKEIDMYQLANTLGIDSQKYALREKNENGGEETNFEEKTQFNISISTKVGLTTICPECNHEKVINKINNQDKIQVLLRCDTCLKLNKNFGVIFNNVVMNMKKNMFNYFKGNKKCQKCSIKTRFPFKMRCNDANCKNGVFYKEIKEGEVSNEINFLGKLFEADSNMSNSNLNNFNSTTQNNIRDLVKTVSKRIDYNTVDLDKLFNFLKLNEV